MTTAQQMTGTEKQIAWAQDIVADMVQTLDDYLATDPSKAVTASAGTWILRRYGLKRDDVPDFIAWVQGMTDAAQIIDWFSPRQIKVRGFTVRCAYQKRK